MDIFNWEVGFAFSLTCHKIVKVEKLLYIVGNGGAGYWLSQQKGQDMQACSVNKKPFFKNHRGLSEHLVPFLSSGFINVRKVTACRPVSSYWCLWP